MYTVKETAKLMEMSEHTIRYYTDQGLVPTVKRDKNNNRLFDEESLNWLTSIKCLRECGMSIDAIKQYCDLCLEGDATVEARYKIILAQKEAAEKQLAEAEKRVAFMHRKVQLYQDTLERHMPDVTNPIRWPVSAAAEQMQASS